MPQEFHVIRCFNCNTFQVHQVKKSKKWNCKLCGEKQSIVKVYAQGSGAQCRHHVQQLNMIKGGLETAKDELVQSLHTVPLLSTSERYGCYNEIESYTDGKNQHSRWAHYTEHSEDEEAHCPEDEDSSDVIYTTDRMLLPRQPSKRKKKVKSSGFTDDDQSLKKKYVNRSNKNGTTSETMEFKPFMNFKSGSCCRYENPKSKFVETFDEANVKESSSAIRKEVLNGENYAESFGYAGNKYQQNMLKRNTFVKKEISEITVNNKNMGGSKNNIPIGLDPCIKTSPVDEIDGSKTFSNFQRYAQYNNEFESKNQSCKLRTENIFPSTINPSKKKMGSQSVMTCKTENLSKTTKQSKWSKFTDEYIDDENNDCFGEANCQEQSEKYGHSQFNPSEEEDESTVLINSSGLHFRYTVGSQENSPMSAPNSDYGGGINFGNQSDVSIHHGKLNMLMSSRTIFKYSSKPSELQTRSHVHKDARVCGISMEKKVPNRKLHWLSFGDISDDEFEL
ncbi:hypothetical protein ACJMK2_003909 [Sinanodonta woodiana]|uniref:MRN complex-interacting protein N-terminal domain-containing protein n=1 Tax=Sinanodonta woodiana TaxID=1069815 RepID=A0ABD3Y080_SINWO